MTWALCVQHGAPVIFFVFFIVPRDFIFFLNAGTISCPCCPWELQRFPAGAQLLLELHLRGVLCVVGGAEIWELKEVKFVFGS